MTVWEVVLPNGDRAEATSVEAILHAARVLALDVRPQQYGGVRRLLQGAHVTRDGLLDGVVTGRLRGC